MRVVTSIKENTFSGQSYPEDINTIYCTGSSLPYMFTFQLKVQKVRQLFKNVWLLILYCIFNSTREHDNPSQVEHHEDEAKRGPSLPMQGIGVYVSKFLCTCIYIPHPFQVTQLGGCIYTTYMYVAGAPRLGGKCRIANYLNMLIRTCECIFAIHSFGYIVCNRCNLYTYRFKCIPSRKLIDVDVDVASNIYWKSPPLILEFVR